MKYSSAERRFNVMVKHPPVGGWVLSFQANSNAAIFLMRMFQQRDQELQQQHLFV